MDENGMEFSQSHLSGHFKFLKYVVSNLILVYLKKDPY